MIATVVFLGSLVTIGIALVAAFLILWLGHSAPPGIRRAWRALATLLISTSVLHGYVSLHIFLRHAHMTLDPIDIFFPVVSLCGSATILVMVFLARDSFAEPLPIADLKAAAFTDTLTGLSNRRSFDMAMAEAMEIARRRGQPLTLILLDIDHFKKVNDHHGHDGGDAVLRAVGRCLRRGQRDGDMAFRIGGEEFTVALPMTDLSEGALVADRLRRRLAELRIEKDGEVILVTMSAGVAELRPDDDAAALMQRADAALYSAKRAGRNQVCIEAGSAREERENAAARGSAWQ